MTTTRLSFRRSITVACSTPSVVRASSEAPGGEGERQRALLHCSITETTIAMAVTFAEVGSSILLFFIVFGMSATVDMKHMRKQVRNRNALLTGISRQFIILLVLGFCVVKTLNMSAPMGITLLVVTSSPGREL